MEIIKNSEKILIWLHRQNKTINFIADYLRISRQTVSTKLKGNSFTDDEIRTLKRIISTI